MNQPEVWLRGPVTGIPGTLQPVAHALLQAREELNDLMKDFPEALLWERPAGLASPGFHLQHMKGVLDRLFTYAGNHPLTAIQLEQLAAEGKPNGSSAQELLQQLNEQVDATIDRLRKTPGHVLSEARGVGRAQLPSTVLGLMVHAAEHTMRHLGQLLVTVKVLKGKI